MKPASIESRKARRKREAVQGVVLFALLQIACVAGFASLCWIPNLPRWAFYLFAALAVACLLPLPVAVKVLRQRFKEIEGGELDAAGQY